jgi:hypothetical protein
MPIVILSAIMLNVIIVIDVMLSAIMSGIMMNVIILNVIMLNANIASLVMLIVVIVSVMAPLTILTDTIRGKFIHLACQRY